MALAKSRLKCLCRIRRQGNPFRRVALSYTEEMALEEAPDASIYETVLREGCPVNVRIPEFINLMRRRNTRSYQRIKSTNSLPAVCGRVCPQEIQCESGILGRRGEPVAIGRLEILSPTGNGATIPKCPN